MQLWCQAKINFDPLNAQPLHLGGDIEKCRDLINALPEGCNYISPAVDRMEHQAFKRQEDGLNQKLEDYIHYMVEPALSSLFPNKPIFRHDRRLET